MKAGPPPEEVAARRCAVALVLTLGGAVALAVVAGEHQSQGSAAFGTFWAVLGVVGLALALVSLRRGDAGGAAAWTACALLPLGILALLAATLFGLVTCGPATLSCEQHVAAYWLPFLLFAAALYQALRCIAATRTNRSSP